MEVTIKLKSRGDNNNYLKKMNKPDGQESKTYLLKTDSPNLRSGNLENNSKFIDPSGGPMLVVGEFLEEANATIKSIDYIIGYGYTVTFK